MQCSCVLNERWFGGFSERHLQRQRADLSAYSDRPALCAASGLHLGSEFLWPSGIVLLSFAAAGGH